MFVQVLTSEEECKLQAKLAKSGVEQDKTVQLVEYVIKKCPRLK